MSSYVDFSRCVICRSYMNLIEYEKRNGTFEVTMLLNTLYLAVMYPFEERRSLHIKSKNVAELLKKFSRIEQCGNEFNSDDLMRYFRNSMAHFNIKVSSSPRKGSTNIEEILFWAKNNGKPKPLCKEPCENPKCASVPMLNENTSKAICEFHFTANNLRIFTDAFIAYALRALPNTECKRHNCQFLSISAKKCESVEEQELGINP